MCCCDIDPPTDPHSVAAVQLPICVSSFDGVLCRSRLACSSATNTCHLLRAHQGRAKWPANLYPDVCRTEAKNEVRLQFMRPLKTWTVRRQGLRATIIGKRFQGMRSIGINFLTRIWREMTRVTLNSRYHRCPDSFFLYVQTQSGDPYEDNKKIEN